MSIRRRNIQTRIARDLELERGNHRVTRGLLEARGTALAMALDERDASRRELSRFKDLAAELARYFHSDPPAPLSRETDLFLLLQEVAPGFIRPLPPPPPTPAEVLETFSQMIGTSTTELVELAALASSVDAVTGNESR